MEYIIQTPCGTLKGCRGLVEGTVAYKGIRYATAGRFEYPKQVTSWEGIYDATEYGACSYQPRAFLSEELNNAFYYNEFRKGETYTYSEDCLFLNVFTPETAKEGDKLPVLVYIHGGAFSGGCGHEKHFNEPVWPTKGIVGITLNYRLGPLGFMCLPELIEEAGHTGNYGLYDQMTAIKWVKDNIAAFGGDPENITIMGQSAGAMSVQLQSVSPLTKGLFQKAIMSSGCGLCTLRCGTMEKSLAFWSEVMKRSGCETLAEFRALPVKQLFDIWQVAKKEMEGGKEASYPVENGDFLVANREPHDISYIAGSTSEDIRPPMLYTMAHKWIAKRKQPSYVWYFNRQLPGDNKGAWHSADLWYWFGTFKNCWRPMEEKDYHLSNEMVSYLCNFVANGDPNKGGELPVWAPTTAKQRKVLMLGEKDTHMGKPNMLKMLYVMYVKEARGEKR